MRIDEIESREDLGRVLGATLSEGWSEQYGREHRVRFGGAGGDQPWYVQPLLSCYCVRRPSSEARRFAADSFRYTRRLRRALAQWALGTALASPLGLRLTARRAFTVTPALPGAAGLLVVPGNQRVRIFDLGRRSTRVLLKAGFAEEAISTELEVRGPGRKGPFPTIAACGPGWFEERLIEGFPLSRCPPWRPFGTYERQAFRMLDSWQDRTVERVSAAEHAARLREVAAARLDELAARFGAPAERLRPWPGRLAHGARALDTVEIARGHGDFQPGNVLVERRDGRITLTDWEYSAVRYRPYDFLTYRLGMRAPATMAPALRAYVRAGAPAPMPHVPAGRKARRAQLALVLLEELVRLCQENLSGAYLRPSQSFGGTADALAALDDLI